jgi:hypothetical protein
MPVNASYVNELSDYYKTPFTRYRTNLEPG